MKKIICLLFTLLLTVQLCAVAVPAAQVDLVPMGICAVVSDCEGNTAIESADAVGELDTYESYDLYVDREPVLAVDLQNKELAASGAAVPKLYHADFMIPETTCQVYLTGLRSENVEELQSLIIKSFTAGYHFDLTDLTFIDTEKTALNDGDENLCWAAASSNILYSTGWGAQAGFSDENAIFDLFASSFTDDGSHQENAMSWFFNGAALHNNYVSFFGSRIRNYGRSGAYLKDYAYDMVSGYNYVRGAGDLGYLYDLLTQGCDISPGILLENGGSNVGSHAITLWGLVLDHAYTKDDPAYYSGVLISDSDSDMINNRDRRKAPRVLSYYPLYVNKDNLFCFDYDEDLTAIWDDYEYLIPYSTDIPRETDRNASRDKINTADLIIGGAYLSDSYAGEMKELYESGSDLFFQYAVASAADKKWRSNIKTDRRITDANGKTIFHDTDTITISYFSGLQYIEMTDPRSARVNNVPAGDYTLTFTVNPNHDSAEAYYYNNTYSIEFRVRDSFICGDYNNDRTVDITDATMIQLELSESIPESDIKTAERCDLDENGLDITDASRIQRYLVELETPYPIGEKALYNAV